jgi:hypothetical protein
MGMDGAEDGVTGGGALEEKAPVLLCLENGKR